MRDEAEKWTDGRASGSIRARCKSSRKQFILCCLTAMICRSHRQGPGSTPGKGTLLLPLTSFPPTLRSGLLAMSGYSLPLLRRESKFGHRAPFVCFASVSRLLRRKSPVLFAFQPGRAVHADWLDVRPWKDLDHSVSLAGSEVHALGGTFRVVRGVHRCMYVQAVQSTRGDSFFPASSRETWRGTRGSPSRPTGSSSR